ncbi:MAG TPA: MarR family transcriptional regulator [Candidatus Limnocylindrales bacterium]|nr:MarR family transcriptional regulator [Candidatus Limnocylindrales bacterium]
MRTTNALKDRPVPLFPRDEGGCLYDPRVREAVERSGETAHGLQMEAVAALRLASKKLHLAMERYADKHGLSEGRMYVLFRLLSEPGHRLPLGELAETLLLAPRTITGLIDTLERDGWVSRVNDPQDRRSIYAQLTPEGVARIDQLRRQAALQQSSLTHDFSDQQLLQLRDLCLRIVQNLESAEGDPHAG